MKSNTLLEKKITFNGKEVHLKGEEDYFNFKCVGCANCCKNSLVVLSPYELFLLSKKFNISMALFREKYTNLMIFKNGKVLPKIVLKTKGQCIFLKNNKCTIYSDRPNACRLYPLGVTVIEGKTHYFNLKESSCGPCVNTKNQIKIKEYLGTSFTDDRLALDKEWLLYEETLQKLGLPLKNKKFVVDYITIFYEFDNPFLKEKIEKSIGTLSEDPKKLIHQVMKYASDFIQQQLSIQQQASKIGLSQAGPGTRVAPIHVHYEFKVSVGDQ